MGAAEADSVQFEPAVERVYAAPPEEFVQLRSGLVASARASGDKVLATRIAALRKPTSAAAVVNRQVLADPSVADRLSAIGDQLRAAQGNVDGIDRNVLRELSVTRRTVVQDVSARALETFGPSAGPAVRDEVIATFDAAVADPEIAARLGRLTHAEQWSGIGAVADGPALTVVRGGSRSAPKSGSRAREQSREQSREQGSTARNSTSSGAGARRDHGLSAAEHTLSAAEQNLSTALQGEHVALARVADLEKRVSELQKELATAGREAKQARAAVRSARSRHRQAGSSRDRAARRNQS